MKVYIVMVKDRHTDPGAFPFSNPEQAIEEARRIAKDWCSFDEDYEEEGQSDGWLFHARYSCEGDCIWVVEKEIDQPIQS